MASRAWWYSHFLTSSYGVNKEITMLSLLCTCYFPRLRGGLIDRFGRHSIEVPSFRGNLWRPWPTCPPNKISEVIFVWSTAERGVEKFGSGIPFTRTTPKGNLRYRVSGDVPMGTFATMEPWIMNQPQSWYHVRRETVLIQTKVCKPLFHCVLLTILISPGETDVMVSYGVRCAYSGYFNDKRLKFPTRFKPKLHRNDLVTSQRERKSVVDDCWSLFGGNGGGHASWGGGEY